LFCLLQKRTKIHMRQIKQSAAKLNPLIGFNIDAHTGTAKGIPCPKLRA